MDERQRDHITRNKSNLILLTDCNVSFISYLVAKEVLGDYDKESLRTIDNNFDKAAKFYDIVVNKANSYDIVREALKETVQTGALAVLDDIGNSPGSSTNKGPTLPDFESRIRKRVRYEVRSPVQLFTGRKAELASLHEHMKYQDETGNTTIITQTASVTGLGGIGKTELCRKYVELYSEHYDGNVIWIQAEREVDMTRDFKIVAKDHLKISLKDVDGVQKDIKTVVDEVYNYFQRKKVIFVFDNAVCSDDESLDTFMPIRVSTKPAILITSRDRDWREMPSKILAVGELKEEEAVEFVTKGLEIENGSQNEPIKKLVNRLQYFPLAIQQAISFIKERGKLRTFEISEYLSLFETNTKQLLKEKAGRLASNKYSETTYTTWKITTDIIALEEEFGELSIKCLNIMSYFQPDRISIELFSRSDGIPKDSSFEVDSALQLLLKYSMINSQPTEKMLSIHRLVQEVTRIDMKCKGKEQHVLRDCLSIFLPEIDRDQVGHAKSVLNFSIAHPSLVKEFSIVPCNVGEVLTDMFSKECREFCDKWNQILSGLLPEGAVEIIHFEFFFAQQLHEEKKYDECLEAFNLVLAKYMSIQGQKQHEIFLWRTNRFIAETLKDLDRLEESLELAKIVFGEQIVQLPKIKIKELVYTAIVAFYDHLMLGNFEGALDWCEKVLDSIYQDKSLSASQERRDLFHKLCENERMSCYLKEIGMRVTKLMEINENWNVFGMILANYLAKIGNDTDSLQLATTIYEFSKKMYGEQEPKVLIYLVRVGLSHLKMGKFEEAVAIFRKPGAAAMIEDRDSQVGNKTIGSMAALFAVALSKTGAHEEALQKLFKILDSHTEIHGREHKHVVEILHEIAMVHTRMKKYKEALEIWVDAKKIAEKVGGIDAGLLDYIRRSVAQLTSILKVPE